MARGDVEIDGRKLQAIRERLLLTQGQFADKIGVSRGWVGKAEKEGHATVLRKLAGEVADALQLNPHDLLYVSKQGLEVVQMRKFPVFNVSIPAGKWSDSGEARSVEDADDWVELPMDVPDDAFCLRIIGDCMEPEYPSGSVLVFVPIRPGEAGVRQFESGKDYYFEHSDGKSTFKRVFYEDGKERFRLECLNKKYKPFHVPEQMLARMSRAIRVVQIRHLV